jgi:succinate dehydrogenase / fumarate reductase, iron-sulfur subunit
MSLPQTSFSPKSASETKSSPQQRRSERKHVRTVKSESQSVTEDRSDLTGETGHLKVFRYDPDVEDKQDPRYDDFVVPYERE